MKTQVVRFDPRNGFAEHITGESGCECGHSKIAHSMNTSKCLISIDDTTECPCSRFKPSKAQTIRAKPIEVGQKVALWEMWRGMKEGCYSSCCWSRWGDFEHTCCGAAHRLEDTIAFPRKLLETTIREVVPIEMKLNWGGVNGLYICPNEKLMSKGVVIPYNTGQHPFVKADTPNWTNKQFIDFFLKTYPDIKKRWVPFWIWKW